MFVDTDIIVQKFTEHNHLLEGKWWKHKLPKELKVFLFSTVDYLSSELTAAADSLCFEFHSNVLQDLPKSMHVILLYILDQKKPENGIKFEQMHFDLTNKKWTGPLRGGIDNYSKMVLKDCLLKLEKMRILHISRIPIVMESVIMLLIPPTLIENIKVKEKLSLDFSDNY